MATPKENISLGFAWVVSKLNTLKGLIPTKTSDLINDGEDTNAPFVQEDGLKTVNGNSLIGAGNIEIISEGVQTVTGPKFDNSDPLNPVFDPKPTITADTGTAIDMGDIFGNECNMLAANTNSAFTLTNIKPGGEATVLINRATEPTVSGATKIAGHTFQASTNMHLKVKCRQSGIVQYYFLKLT